MASYKTGPAIGIIAGGSMVICVAITCLVGIAVPFAFSKIGMDPAAASSPFVTSVADILGVLIYFTMAKMVMGL